MNKRIIYMNNEGNLSIIIPVDCGLTIEQIAQKDVPKGVPYLIINSEDVPQDRSNREAWEADFSNPDGIGLGQEDWFNLNQSSLHLNNSPIVEQGE